MGFTQGQRAKCLLEVESLVITITVDTVAGTAIVHYPLSNEISRWSLDKDGGRYDQIALGFLIWHPLVDEFKYIYNSNNENKVQFIKKSKK